MIDSIFFIQTSIMLPTLFSLGLLLLIVEFNGPPSWSLGVKETGESTKYKMRTSTHRHFVLYGGLQTDSDCVGDCILYGMVYTEK